MPLHSEVRARVDAHIKAEAHAVLAEIGLTVPDAVRLMLNRVARDKALPFESWEPDQETIEAIEASRRGEDSKSFDSVEELIADLYADD